MKGCIDCQIEKDVGDFYLSSTGKPACVCKDCHKARMKRRRLTNPAVQEYDRARYRDPKRKQAGSDNSRRWRESHPEAYRAHTAVNNALRDGRLKKNPCSICGRHDRVQGHHKDYSKPLDVVWLCAKCHHRLHSTFPELGGHHEVAS